MQPAPEYAPPLAPVPQGPRAYRRRLRQAGPVAGLLPPAALGGLALLLLHDNTATWRGVLGFLTAVLAAPALLAAGAPLKGGTGLYAVAVVASAVVWLGLSVLATRRATRLPVASWRDFWREYAWLAGGVWLGVVGALVGANLILGRALL
ncbi:MAG: hypothetical protein Q7V88_18005 [Actinomycetota bacterium]|nr:hypothetical protein [Actinomycetota bacterium]